MPGPRFSPLGRTLITAALLCVGVAAVFSLHLEALGRSERLPPEREVLYLPRPGALRAVSLGYTELMADLVWVRQVLYVGEHLTGRGDVHWINRYLEAIAALDPHFRRVYTWAGVMLVYGGGPTTNAMVRESNALLERGLRYFPDDWELNFMLGGNYLHALKTSDPKVKAGWKLRAAEYMRRAALTGKGPSWLPVLVATLLTKGGETDAAIRHLEEILLTTEDESVRTQVRNKLTQLRAQALPEMERHREAFVRAWRASLGYAPGDLYVILGDPPADTDVASLAVPDLMRTWSEALENDARARPAASSALR